LHQLTWRPLQSLLLLLPLRPGKSGLCSSRFASQARLGKGNSWMGGGTQTQMLMQRSMTYPAKEEIGIETVAVPGSHPTRSVRQSPLTGRLPAGGNRTFFGTVRVDG
jgi:hypothetical protein